MEQAKTQPSKAATVLFDIDGTLLLSQRAGGRAIDQVFTQTFGVPRQGELRLHGRTDRGILTELFTAQGRELTEAAFEQFIRLYLEELDRNLHQSPAQVLPGVTEVLAWLEQVPDVEVGLLTGNVRAGAMLKLSHTGLQPYFPFGGFGDRHAHRDDVAREAAHQAAGYLQARFCPQSLIVIGDTVHDVTCARAIGARSIAVLTGGAPAQELAAAGADIVCHDLADGISVLQHFLSEVLPATIGSERAGRSVRA
jgi:phosphoglycolate phosphatase-like HAD superfamily hydrolase